MLQNRIFSPEKCCRIFFQARKEARFDVFLAVDFVGLRYFVLQLCIGNLLFCKENVISLQIQKYALKEVF